MQKNGRFNAKCSDAFRPLIARCFQSPGKLMFFNPRGRRPDAGYSDDTANRIWFKACKKIGFTKLENGKEVAGISLYNGTKHSTMDYYLNDLDLTETHIPDYRKPVRISDPELREKFESAISQYESSLSEYEAIETKYIENKQLDEIEAVIRILLGLDPMEGFLFDTQDEFLYLFRNLPKGFRIESRLSFRKLKNDLLAAAHKYDSQIVQVDGDIIFEFIFEIDNNVLPPIFVMLRQIYPGFDSNGKTP